MKKAPVPQDLWRKGLIFIFFHTNAWEMFGFRPQAYWKRACMACSKVFTRMILASTWGRRR